jgi:hypothetical protein
MAETLGVLPPLLGGAKLLIASRQAARLLDRLILALSIYFASEKFSPFNSTK